MVAYRSKHGGLWTDRSDREQVLQQKVYDGEISLDDQFLFEKFMKDGFVIVEGAIDHALCDAMVAELDQLVVTGDANVLVYGSPEPDETSRPVPPNFQTRGERLVDQYCVSDTARKILTAPVIERFLHTAFEMPPLIFQSLTFIQGSEQHLHQDTAYVVVNEPMKLIAAWIALEDVVEGSGELTYLRGSHQLPDFGFGEDRKHWNPQLDGDGPHDEWLKWIVRRSEELGFERQTFLARKGDVLFWSADLVHGGSPLSDPNQTRKSLVGHYCPVSANPHYFSYMPDRIKIAEQSFFFSSSYYDARVIGAPELLRPTKQTSDAVSFVDKRSIFRKIGGRVKRRLSRTGS